LIAASERTLFVPPRESQSRRYTVFNGCIDSQISRSKISAARSEDGAYIAAYKRERERERQTRAVLQLEKTEK